MHAIDQRAILKVSAIVLLKFLLIPAVICIWILDFYTLPSKDLGTKVNE